MKKLQSRKFWVSVAAMLGSFASSIAGLSTGNENLVTIGVTCGVLSAGIYAFCEAWVDAKAVEGTPEEGDDE